MRNLIKALVLAAVANATPVTASAQTVVAAHTIRNKAVITFEDIVLLDTESKGSIGELELVAGMEARTILYQGRPIRPQDIGPPALIERNQIVSIVYKDGSLVIMTEGRALNRGGLGDRVRVLNLSSKMAVTGTVESSGKVKVSQ
jgi:flagellar basal body P-ring formation protein FlgA